MPGERANTFFEEGLRKLVGSTATPNNSSMISTASKTGFISRYRSNICASIWLKSEDTTVFGMCTLMIMLLLIYITGLSQAVPSLISDFSSRRPH